MTDARPAMILPRALARARVSGVVNLARCPGLWVARVSGPRDESGPAAQTGSAVGRMIELWHRGTLPAEIMSQVRSEAERWPSADLTDNGEAQLMAAAYFSDGRNAPGSDWGTVDPGSLEREVQLLVPPDPLDPTGEPVLFVGHLDQARRGRDGFLRVWDTKCGKPSGSEMLQEYAWQLAVYTLAAGATYGETVLPGGLIRLRDYETGRGKARGWGPDAPGVYYAAPWSLDDCRAMLGSIMQEIALVRMGRVALRPGLHCRYCPLQPHWDCHSRVPNPFTGADGSTTAKEKSV